jgi:hypothetical protein
LIKAGGRYADIYRARKEVECERAAERGLLIAPSAKIPKKQADKYISDGHIHRRAQRYMEKKLLRDLWNAWRRSGMGMPARAERDLPAAMPTKRAA